MFCIDSIPLAVDELLISCDVVCARGLREARDMALSEKERAGHSEKDTSVKYEQLLQEFDIALP